MGQKQLNAYHSAFRRYHVHFTELLLHKSFDARNTPLLQIVIFTIVWGLMRQIGPTCVAQFDW
ncbi:hypothetical protein SAMN04488118_104227 [Epibacterium ulvae]|uniref:Uncharacterized protein n=1 Tax=Epibacterium ulvae TaxID=1156985 RepID=A0A1G5QHX0_9RHOB|nr:hypothetical protein SAMN04488118_104227 [Epibacterium ulvae]